MSQDLVRKKQNLAASAIAYSTQLVDALNGLQALALERAVLGEDFQDSDFVTPDLGHLTAGIVGTLFDFVVPSLQANYEDNVNAGRNRQILLQMRK